MKYAALAASFAVLVALAGPAEAGNCPCKARTKVHVRYWAPKPRVVVPREHHDGIARHYDTFAWIRHRERAR